MNKIYKINKILSRGYFAFLFKILTMAARRLN